MQALSERRAALIRDYLVAQGIPAEKIQTRAEGKDQQINMKTVEALESKDQEKPTKWMIKHQKSTWLAYNQCTDIILEPSGKESAKIYPAQSADARILWQRPMPSLKKVEQASNVTSANVSSGVQQASLKHTSSR